jgi:hypothetical protein
VDTKDGNKSTRVYCSALVPGTVLDVAHRGLSFNVQSPENQNAATGLIIPISQLGETEAHSNSRFVRIHKTVKQWGWSVTELGASQFSQFTRVQWVLALGGVPRARGHSEEETGMGSSGSLPGYSGNTQTLSWALYLTQVPSPPPSGYFSHACVTWVLNP